VLSKADGASDDMQGGFEFSVYEGDELILNFKCNLEFLSEAVTAFVEDVGGLDKGQELRIKEIS